MLVTIPLLLYFGFATASKALEMYSLRQESAKLQREIAGLQQRNAELLQQKEFLRSDEYIERIAREELDLVKPGETPLVIITPPDQAGTRRLEREQRPKEQLKPNWQLWWDFLFGPL